MKILVVGHKGNMGRRYMAILKHLHIDVIGVDQGDIWPSSKEMDGVIIATPTDEHIICIQYLINILGYCGRILCEKPISKAQNDLFLLRVQSEIVGCDIRMVCNWSFVKPGVIFQPNQHRIIYDCYNTGKDGLAWDVIQLIYLAKGFPDLQTSCPTFRAEIDGERISLDAIAESYVTMVKTWIESPEKLWGLQDALWASQKVMAYIDQSESD